MNKQKTCPHRNSTAFVPQAKRRWHEWLVAAMAIVASMACLPAGAQTLIGSPGAAGWQSWTLDDILCGSEITGANGAPYNTCIPASGSGGIPAPYWNSEFGAAGPNDEGNPAEKNVGFCMTSTGDCQGVGSALFAPGTLQFWALTPFVSGKGALGTGGARDPNVHFQNSGTTTRHGFRWNSYKATLYLNSGAVPCGINAFGWFETDAGGTTIGKMHELFQGTGEPRYACTTKPSPVGSTVTFTPTQYFGFYYSDVSEPTEVNGVADHGCYAYTLYNLNEPNCQESNQGAHDFVIFSTNPGSSNTTYWIGAEDPTDCTTQDGDCNLTLVKISPAGGN
jgi:hypothetical protein